MLHCDNGEIGIIQSMQPEGERTIEIGQQDLAGKVVTMAPDNCEDAEEASKWFQNRIQLLQAPSESSVLPASSSAVEPGPKDDTVDPGQADVDDDFLSGFGGDVRRGRSRTPGRGRTDTKTKAKADTKTNFTTQGWERERETYTLTRLLSKFAPKDATVTEQAKKTIAAYTIMATSLDSKKLAALEIRENFMDIYNDITALLTCDTDAVSMIDDGAHCKWRQVKQSLDAQLQRDMDKLVQKLKDTMSSVDKYKAIT